MGTGCMLMACITRKEPQLRMLEVLAEVASLREVAVGAAAAVGAAGKAVRMIVAW